MLPLDFRIEIPHRYGFLVLVCSNTKEGCQPLSDLKINKLRDDSGDDGFCDGDIDLKKDSNLNFQKRRVQCSSKRFKKEFKCGRCCRGLEGVAFL